MRGTRTVVPHLTPSSHLHGQRYEVVTGIRAGQAAQVACSGLGLAPVLRGGVGASLGLGVASALDALMARTAPGLTGQGHPAAAIETGAGDHG